MDILGPLSKTRHGSRFLLVISDRYTKITRTVPLRTITALTITAQAFCEHWVYISGPPVSLLTDTTHKRTAKWKGTTAPSCRPFARTFQNGWTTGTTSRLH